MKKSIIRILALVTVVALSCVALTSCGLFPPTDPFDAKANLERNEYGAVKYDTDSMETVLLGELHFAGINDFTCVVKGWKGDEYVEIIYFESSDQAKAEFAEVEAYVKGRRDYKETWKIKQFGTIVYYGTELAIKAASK